MKLKKQDSRLKIGNLRLYNLIRANLDAGESEAITLASEVNAIVLLDEKDARNLAEKIGLKVMGLWVCLSG